jgi:hypothetical protein
METQAPKEEVKRSCATGNTQSQPFWKSLREDALPFISRKEEEAKIFQGF